MHIFLYLLTLIFSQTTSTDSYAKDLPGTLPYSKELQEKITGKYKNIHTSYTPRTKHLEKNGKAIFTNRLFLQKSPYLNQHAHNPVNWYPWGKEAFSAAKKLNRPILLSVGYSTCHWCHVMEEESFENIEIAKYLNENYIAIKVDREERPDVDSVYMKAVQTLTGRGGWPMTVWLTPSKKPFFGGTYFPPHDRGRPGFLSLLKKLSSQYQEDPANIESTGVALTKRLQRSSSGNNTSEDIKKEILNTAATYYEKSFDAQYGGIKRAPKFPSSFANRFLLRYARRKRNSNVLPLVIQTLTQMADGGIYDHVAGGFHRYATDRKWLVPHFEKMLYDNALLASTYIEAYQATNNSKFKYVATDVLDYLIRDMRSPNGAFYSATDADSLTPEGHREEGWFFTWTPKEIRSVLTPEESKLILSYYNISNSGNFEGKNILNIQESLKLVAQKLEISLPLANRILSESKEKLYQHRLTRPKPIRDEKILTAWNALAASAFAQASIVFNRPDYKQIAIEIAEFILNNMYKKGRLLRSYAEGDAYLDAYLNDYVFYITTCLDIFEATQDVVWLQKAIDFDKTLSTLFEDQKFGGFYTTSSEHEKLLLREKPSYDGAIPSGNSVAALNLLRLNEYTLNKEYKFRATKLLSQFSNTLEHRPAALSEMLLAVDFLLDMPKEILILKSDNGKSKVNLFTEVLRSTFLPNRAVVFSSVDKLTKTSSIVPFIKEKSLINGKTTAYVCTEGRCKLPTTSPKIFKNQVEEVEFINNTK